MRMGSIRERKNPGLYEAKAISSISQLTSIARHTYTCKLLWKCLKKFNFAFALVAQGGGSHI